MNLTWAPLSCCVQLAHMFKTTPGLGIFSFQAQAHVFAPPLDAAGESSVFTEVHTGRSSMMVFWVDKLPAKLVEALEDAVQPVRAIVNK